jgi:hypothetical protein
LKTLWNKFPTLIRWILVTLTVCTVAAVAVEAATNFPFTHTITGSGTILKGTSTPANLDFNITLTSDTTNTPITSVDFSNTTPAPLGAAFSDIVEVTINNTGTDNSGSATINSVAVTSPDLPAGWTISSPGITNLAAGHGAVMNLTLTGPTVTSSSSTTIPSFTIVFTAN